MKNKYSILNLILIVAVLVGDACYMQFGGLSIKTPTSIGFVLLGAVNLAYAVRAGRLVRFQATLTAGLLFAMLGDVLLHVNFILGAGLFALGHVLYFAAFCQRGRYQPADVLPSAALFLFAVLLVTLYPAFDFGSTLMYWVIVVYALVISLMVGKAFSDYRRSRGRMELLLMIGSALFFFSDLMLVLWRFADAPYIVDRLCLLSYYPAQCLLAHAAYQELSRG